MEDIIKQIAQIDSVAVSNRKNSELALKERREQYEREMITYREKSIDKAKIQAEQIYNEMVRDGEKNHDVESEKCKQLILDTKQRYIEAEEGLLNEVISQLFRVEG